MLRAQLVDNLQKMHSLTMEYYPHKSLQALICEYADIDNIPPNPEHIPEPFIWRVFHSLAEIGMAMEKGHARPNRPSLADWQQIVHREVKPSNIFLAAPIDGHFESYPTPKLGDYDLSFMTFPTDPLNPELFVGGGGTEGCKAPEQEAYVSIPDIRPFDDLPMLAHTHVWAVGNAIRCLAEQDVWPRQPNFLGDVNVDGDAHDPMDNKEYNEQLPELVRACMEFDPARRPSLQTVLRRINDAIDEDGLNLAEDTNTGPAKPAHDPECLRHWNAEEYALGLSGQQLPVMLAWGH